MNPHPPRGPAARPGRLAQAGPPRPDGIRRRPGRGRTRLEPRGGSRRSPAVALLGGALLV